MKLLVLALIAISGLARAATDDACTKFMPCGDYEGSGSWYSKDGAAERSYSEKIVISPVDASTVNLKVYIYDGATPGEPWADATIKFQTDGQFTFSQEGAGTFGTGFCGDKVCTIAFRSVLVDDEQGKAPFENSFVDVLRFDGNTLRRFNMVSNGAADSDLAFQRSTLTKK